MNLTNVFYSQFRPESELSSLSQRNEFDGVVPWYVTYQGEKRFHTVFIIQGQTITAHTISPKTGDLTEIDSIGLVNSPYIDAQGIWWTDFVFFGEDTTRVRDSKEGVAETVRSNWNVTVLPPGKRASKEYKRLRTTCGCEDLQSPTVQRVPSESRPYQLYKCQHCWQLHGVELDGKKIPEERLLNPDWVLEGFDGTIIELGSDTDYLIHTSGSHVRINATLDILSDASQGESKYSASYEPDQQSALLYISDSAVAGYLSWNEPVPFQVLRQLYIQPELRRRGFAETLVRTWVDTFCDSETYYLDQPNEMSRPLFDRLDDEHVPEGPTSQEYYALQPILVEY